MELLSQVSAKYPKRFVTCWFRNFLVSRIRCRKLWSSSHACWNHGAKTGKNREKRAKQFISWCSGVIIGISSAKKHHIIIKNVSLDVKYFTLVTASFAFVYNRSLVFHATVHIKCVAWHYKWRLQHCKKIQCLLYPGSFCVSTRLLSAYFRVKFVSFLFRFPWGASNRFMWST